MLSMGMAWVTLWKPSTGCSETRWVGESGVIRAGWTASSFLSSEKSLS